MKSYILMDLVIIYLLCIVDTWNKSPLQAKKTNKYKYILGKN